MIICFEGAPATGKTTLAKRLVEQGAYRISEINERCNRPLDADKYWYQEQQIQRWSEAARIDELIILDGDVFQPIWFNWMYPDGAALNWRESLRFFEENADRIGVPDQYLFLWVNEEERTARELNRSLLQGRTPESARAKTVKYQSMRKLEQTYFEALAQTFPGLVTVKQAEGFAAPFLRERTPNQPHVLELLSFMRTWLGSNDPITVLEDAD